MELPDGSILMHAGAPYDPQKAHEYYLKNRELKGRKKGSAKPEPGFQAGGSKKSNSYTVTSARGTVKLSPKQLAEQRAYAQERIRAITSKIHKLESVLRKKMAEAKAKERDSKKPDTAAEKREKAKESEQYRDKHKQELKNKAKKAASEKKSGPDLDTVDGLKTAISNAKASLSKAIDRQRALASAKKTG